jgi:hypothetical protein
MTEYNNISGSDLLQANACLIKNKDNDNNNNIFNDTNTCLFNFIDNCTKDNNEILTDAINLKNNNYQNNEFELLTTECCPSLLSLHQVEDIQNNEGQHSESIIKKNAYYHDINNNKLYQCFDAIDDNNNIKQLNIKECINNINADNDDNAVTADKFIKPTKLHECLLTNLVISTNNTIYNTSDDSDNNLKYICPDTCNEDYLNLYKNSEINKNILNKEILKYKKKENLFLTDNNNSISEQINIINSNIAKTTNKIKYEQNLYNNKNSLILLLGSFLFIIILLFVIYIILFLKKNNNVLINLTNKVSKAINNSKSYITNTVNNNNKTNFNNIFKNLF